jgi:hypothetical protein
VIYYCQHGGAFCTTEVAIKDVVASFVTNYMSIGGPNTRENNVP